MVRACGQQDLEGSARIGLVEEVDGCSGFAVCALEVGHPHAGQREFATLVQGVMDLTEVVAVVFEGTTAPAAVLDLGGAVRGPAGAAWEVVLIATA